MIQNTYTRFGAPFQSGIDPIRTLDESLLVPSNSEPSRPTLKDQESPKWAGQDEGEMIRIRNELGMIRRENLRYKETWEKAKVDFVDLKR